MEEIKGLNIELTQGRWFQAGPYRVTAARIDHADRTAYLMVSDGKREWRVAAKNRDITWISDYVMIQPIEWKDQYGSAVKLAVKAPRDIVIDRDVIHLRKMADKGFHYEVEKEIKEAGIRREKVYG